MGNTTAGECRMTWQCKVQCSPADPCFGCKVRTVGMTVGAVRGVLQGQRKTFHGPTIGQRRAQMLTEARAKGVEPREMTRRENAIYHSGAQF